MTQPRHTADSITSDALDRLYARLDEYRESRRRWMESAEADRRTANEQHARAERAEAALNAIRALADETDAYGYSSGWVLTVVNIRAALDTHTTLTETR
ncbi:hypothetical protein [Streptomyces hydrogenans]|uniref:hypothetical protein n=1 Tax=Streptomyces hydrogenans TaxID=1873719 RepID=UPI003808AA4F